MGRFLAYVPDHAIVAAIGALKDETMLRTAFVLEHKDRLDHAVGLLPPDRLPGILRAAAGADLWAEALDLLDHLSDERRGPIADLVAHEDEAIVAALVAAVTEQGIWDGLLPVVRVMSDESRRRLATLPAFHDPAVMTEIIRAAAGQRLWPDLVPLLDALPPAAREALPAIAAQLDPELLANVIADAATAPQTLPTLLAIARAMDRAGQQKVADAITAADERVAHDLVAGLSDDDASPQPARATAAVAARRCHQRGGTTRHDRVARPLPEGSTSWHDSAMADFEVTRRATGQRQSNRVVFTRIDRMIGKDFEKGLSRMQVAVA